MNRSAFTWGEVRRDRALVAVFVAVLLVAMLGFCGLSVDVGYMYVARGDMQRTADASALAGASALMSSDGEVLARAIEVAADNTVNHQSVTPAELDVVIGNWEARQKLFVPVSGGEALAPGFSRWMFAEAGAVCLPAALVATLGCG